MDKLLGNKLILVEGLPSTGKSTNSGILQRQLERNGYKVRWFHEVARPHPTLFFHEACLTRREFVKFVERHPEARNALNKVKIERDKFFGFDLLEIEWNFLKQVGEKAFEALKAFDVWNFSLEKYIEVAIEKWTYFVKQAKKEENNQIIILDSNIFQFQIYTFLLKNAPIHLLKDFITRIYNLIAELNPILLYFDRENIEDTIDYLKKKRGTAFFTTIYKRDCHNPYYLEKPSGVEGYSEFLRDYDGIAKALFNFTPFRKYKIDVTAQNWDNYVQDYLSFLGLDLMEFPASWLPKGVFYNDDLGLKIHVNGLSIIDPMGQTKRLIPKQKNEFYIEDLPVILYFISPKKIIIKGEQLTDRWTTLYTEYTMKN